MVVGPEEVVLAGLLKVKGLILKGMTQGGKTVWRIFTKAGRERSDAELGTLRTAYEEAKAAAAATKGKTNETVRAMMQSQKVAPDLLTKGVHFNVGIFELRVVPDHAGGLTFKPVHPGMAAKNPQAYEAALRQANAAMQSPEFRAWLTKQAEKGLEMAQGAKSPKAAEFKFLAQALGRLQ